MNFQGIARLPKRQSALDLDKPYGEGEMYVILNWWDANHLVAILTEEDGTPLYFKSRKASEKFVAENLSGEFQIVKIHPTTARTVSESRHQNR